MSNNITKPAAATLAAANASITAKPTENSSVSSKSGEPDEVITFLKGTSVTVFPELSSATTVVKAVPRNELFLSLGDLSFAVPKAFTKFGLQPAHCGPNVVFLNATDDAFYVQKLQKPQARLWVLGNSASNSGYVKRRLFEGGFARNIQVEFVCTALFELFATKDGLDTVYYNGEPVDLPDLVLVRVGAKVDYFGLAVLRQLERMGVTVLNGSSSIEISRDKLQTMQYLAGHGLPIPKTLLARFPISIETLEKELEYPLILKKSSGSQGVGIMKVTSSAQLEELVDMLDTKDPLIFQEFIKASSGRDIRVFVVGGRVVASMMRIARSGYKANVHQGGRVEPLKISASVEWLCLEVVRIIGLDCAGVDLLVDTDSVKICEVNSSPGFDGLEKATGIDITTNIMSYIKLRLGVWRVPKRFREVKKGVAVSASEGVV